MTARRREARRSADTDDEYLVMRTATAEDLFTHVALHFDEDFDLIGHEEIRKDGKVEVRPGELWCPLDVHNANWQRKFKDPRARALAILESLERFLNERLREVQRFLRDFAIGEIRVKLIEERRSTRTVRSSRTRPRAQRTR